MAKNQKFDEFQKEWNEQNVESKRFDWLTKDPIINRMEMDLLRRIPIKEGYKVLEVGCGEGQNIINLKKLHKNAKFYGVDMANSRIEFAKKNIGDAVLSVQDGRKIEYKDETFDIVFCRDVIHHMERDRQKFIKEMIRVCKENGKVILLESNGKNILNYIFSSIISKESELKKISKEYMVGLLKSSNLRFKISMVEKHNLQRLLFHYRYGFSFLTNLKASKSISSLIDRLPALRKARSYAYMIIEIDK